MNTSSLAGKRWPHWLCWALLSPVLWFLLSISSWAEDAILPTLSSHVTDLTGTLSESQRSELESRLGQFEKQKGSQVAVLIVPTTQPEAIEQYSMRVAEKWKLGRTGVDDGVLLVIAKDDHKLRIDVGYGLEGALSDIITKRIIEERITPEFKRGNFFAGIKTGVDSILAVISGEQLPAPKVHEDYSNSAGGLFVILIFALAIATLLRAFLGRPLSAGAGAIFALVVGALVAGVGLAIFLAIVSFVLGLAGITQAGRFQSGGWSSTGGGGFGGGFGSSGGDGFSGGGGSFGGGGASGSW